MAYYINEECIACDACTTVCPTHAIVPGDILYFIRMERCTECIIEFDYPQCLNVCPVDCIDKDPGYPETYQQLLEKKYRLDEEVDRGSGSSS